jgi:uncharacterized protein YecE (DUF72 family)
MARPIGPNGAFCERRWRHRLIRIGPAGWNYKDWAGIVYPVKRPKGFSEPGYLSQFFDALEINTSFYGPPRASTAKGWAEAVSGNPRFKFTAKLYKAFTHSRDATQQDEKLVKEGMEPLAAADRLGALLLQFPISFTHTPENLEYLLRLRARFDVYPLVLEVRHSSWNDARALELLAEWGIGICNIDQPLLGRALKPAAEVTSPLVGYVRLHGRNYKNWFSEKATVAERYEYLYSMRELEPWADRMKTVASRTQDTYGITNNHNIGKAVANAVELLALVRGRPVNMPPEWSERFPELGELGVRTV